MKITSKGFTLIESMLGLGLLAVSSLYIMKLQDVNNKAFKGMESRGEMLSLASMARSVISSPDGCMENFGSLNLRSSSSTLITEIRSAGANPRAILEIDTAYGAQGNIKINDMQISPVVSAGVMSRNEFRFSLQMEDETKARYGGRVKNFNFRILATIEPATGEILSCSGPLGSTNNVSKTCTGPGALYDETTGECIIAGVSNLSCPLGQTFTGISFDAASNLYEPVCNETFPTSACPSGEIATGYGRRASGRIYQICESPEQMGLVVGAANVDVYDFFDFTRPTCTGVNPTYSFKYINGKVTLHCEGAVGGSSGTTPIVRACQCSSWGAFNLVNQEYNSINCGPTDRYCNIAPGQTIGYRWYARCNYEKVCASSFPENCNPQVPPGATHRPAADSTGYQFSSTQSGLICPTTI